MKVAIYNSFRFHYEMYGYIIHWCMIKDHELTIYGDINNSFVENYKKEFSNVKYLTINYFEEDKGLYDCIFLTTDDDFKWNRNDVATNKKTICIDHHSSIRNDACVKRIATRPFPPPHFRQWALSTYPVFNVNEKIASMNTNVMYVALVGWNHAYNGDVLNRMKCDDGRPIVIDAVSRFMNAGQFHGIQNVTVRCHTAIDQEALLKILGNANYVVIDTHDKQADQFSITGVLPLAISTLTKLILSTDTNAFFKFQNVIEFNKKSAESIILRTVTVEDIMAIKCERDEHISKNHLLFDSISQI